MYKKINSISIVVIFILFVTNVLYAEQPSPEVIKVAEAYVKNFCGGIIDNGVPYYGPGKGDIVWVFTIYKSSSEISHQRRYSVYGCRSKRETTASRC